MIRPKNSPKNALISAAVAMALSAAMLPVDAVADTGRLERHIAAQDLDTALQAFIRDRAMRLYFQPAQVKGLKTAGVDGNLTAEEELAQLLAGTGLTFQIDSKNAADLVPVVSAQPVQGTALGGGAGDGAPVRLAQATSSGNQGPATGPVGRGPPVVNEVIVTAQKQSEQLQTVPVPVSVLEASDLENYNQLRLQDYFNRLPGLSVAPSVGGVSGNMQLAVRGVIAGQGLNPTVGITIDGVPYGSSIGNGGGNSAPDIDPSELARVELLRGPQGTLFGSSSLGGVLQYVTVDPSTNGFSGRVQVGASDVQNGDHAGYNTRAAFNIPISDDFAVRFSGFTRRDPGYIDDITNGVAGVNEREAYGGHFASLWTPTADFSVKLSALFQHTEQFGQDFADVQQPAVPGEPAPSTDLSRLVQFGRVKNGGVSDDKIQNYSLTLHDHFGTIDLTSISSVGLHNAYDKFDATLFTAPYVNACVFPTLATNYASCYGQPPVAPGTGDTIAATISIKKYTEELRLTAPLGKHVDWLFGLFYSKEISNFLDDLEIVNPLVGTNLAAGGYTDVPTTNQDEAVFTDFTFKISPAFDVQAGGRANINRQRYTESNYLGTFSIPENCCYIAPPGTSAALGSKFTSYTYLLTPRYFILSDGADSVMTYARLASGFRPGGPNTGLAYGFVAGVPPTYGPDKTYNYELGVKADVLDRRLSLDLSVFYIDWKNIQISEVFPTTSAIVNGSRAKSEGVEFQTAVKPWTGLTIDANFTYDNARLTEALSAGAAFADDGARLPFTAQYTANFDVTQEFPLPFGKGMRGFVGGEASYVGGRADLFSTTQDGFRQDLPAYTTVNLRAGTSYNSWTGEVYISNLMDRRGFLSGGINEIPATGFYFIEPRTVGIEISDTL